MLQFFGGGGGTQKFNSTPTAGKPSIAIGNGTFGSGAVPDFQGTAVLGVNMSAGFAGKLFDLQVAGVSQLSVDAIGDIVLNSANISGVGGIAVNTLGGVSGSGTYIATGAGPLIFTSRAAGTPTIVAKGTALQTGDLIEAQDSGSVNHFGIANIGTGVAPIWSLRVAPVSNAASMAQAHVAGAATGLAIEVVDNAGTTLGWLSLVA